MILKSMLTLLLLVQLSPRANAASQLTSESECTSVDLRNDPRLPPAKAQGGNAWCFAYAMATATGFALNEPVSAVGFIMAPDWKRGIRANQKLKQTAKDVEMPQIFNETQNWGFCRERDIPSDLLNSVGDDLDQVYGDIIQPHEEPSCSMAASYDLVVEERIGLAFPLADLSDILKVYSKQKPDQSDLLALGQSSCKLHRFTPERQLQFKWLRVKDDIRAQLNRTLSENKPVGINYSSGPILRSKKNFGHSSNIIGRRWNNGKCEYLVRDPFGAKTLSTRPHTSDGDLYVPEADLIKAQPSFWTID